MQISLIKIRNILGITELECSPGQFNEITGSNDRNKTNLINAIKSVGDGAHDATLLRRGTEKGEIVLVLDDGTEIKKTVTASDSKRAVRKNETTLKKPAEIIASLIDSFSVNPVAFLTAPKADRARVLLESMPIDLDRDRLKKLTGMELPTLHPATHPLAVIDTVRQQVFETRTGVNVAAREKKGTIEQLTQAMPEAPDGIEDDEAGLESQIAAIEQKRVDDLATLEDRVTQWMTAKDENTANLRAAYERQSEELKKQLQALTSQFNDDLADIQASTTLAKARKQTRTEEIRSAAAADREPLAARLSVIKANRDAVTRRKQTLETIKTMQEQLDHLLAESEEHTAALQGIDEYKRELMEKLPIPNVEVINGEITRKGVPFDRLNTAQRVDIAIEIAKLRAGKLGVVCADGLELLDVDAYEDFEQKAIASGLQFFITKVGRGDLQINTRTESHEEVH